MSIFVGIAKNSFVAAFALLGLTAVAYIIFWLSPSFRYFMLSSSKYDLFLKNYLFISKRCEALRKGRERNVSAEKFVRKKTKFIRTGKIFIALLFSSSEVGAEKWHVAYYSFEKDEWMPTSISLDTSDVSSEKAAELIQSL